MAEKRVTLEFIDIPKIGWSEVSIIVDGEHVAHGTYGCDQHSNSRAAGYAWVEEAICALSKALGADVVTSTYVENDDEEDE